MPKKKKEVSIDTTAGSRAYNRLDMQVSQTLQMAIELYDNMNYLFGLCEKNSVKTKTVIKT